MAAERIVIKVGTSVLTQPSYQLDYNVIHQIVTQIGRLRREGHEVVLVTSGAAGASHGLADFGRERHDLLRLQMMTSVGQPRLMQIYADFFREHSVTVAQALLTRYDFGNRERYLSIRDVLEGLLERGIVPIVNENDVVAGEALTFGDNDYLSAAVASTVAAHRLFLLTTAGGFYEGGDPAHNPEARLLPEVSEITPELWASCERTLSLGGRGGMFSKLKAVELATSFGIDGYVVSGKEVDVVPRVLAGEALGTHFLPREKRLKSYRQWLKLGALTSGRVYVDEGAEAALRRNKSLLPAGITRIEGTFQAGDVLEVYSAEHRQLGVGVASASSDELKELQRGTGERTKEAIHRDRLLLV